MIFTSNKPLSEWGKVGRSNRGTVRAAGRNRREMKRGIPGERDFPVPRFYWGPINSGAYLLQVSLTIFKLVTLRSAYSSLLDAFSTCPSFFSSAFSCALDSWVREPATVTV
jgi:hypothetical protein